jgi:hypothetical protein
MSLSEHYEIYGVTPLGEGSVPNGASFRCLIPPKAGEFGRSNDGDLEGVRNFDQRAKGAFFSGD